MVKLSISNIAWEAADDNLLYVRMKEIGYTGLEIAPTRVFSLYPYEKLADAKKWAYNLKNTYGLSISSMQSIWFGRAERLFGTQAERNILIDYTKQAIKFAVAVGCGNLVFGSPKNRNRQIDEAEELAIFFFKEIGCYAADHNVILSLEANPPIYQTNYINTTKEAINLAKEVGTDGIRVNLDLGTVIENQECLEDYAADLSWIHHVHISEPNLKRVNCRDIHQELKALLDLGYSGYVSIEMQKGADVNTIFRIMEEVKEVYYEI